MPYASTSSSPHPYAFAEGFSTMTAESGELPSDDALVHLGRALMMELLDAVAGTALEDVQTILAESLIGAFHSAVGRIERDTDRARDRMRMLDRDFDGSEAADVELQEATTRARAGDLAMQSVEVIREAASECWTTQSGEVWTAWRGSRRGSFLSAAQLEAKQALRAMREERLEAFRPSVPIVAFRGAPGADAPEDASRIFDALNWALGEWPDMALATTGAKGAEKLAIKWAGQKGVTLILARVDFNAHGKAAPFRANDELLALEPTCCLTLAKTLDLSRTELDRPFGPALNLGQMASEAGLRHQPIKARAA